MYTIKPVSTMPTIADPIIGTRISGGITSQATAAKPISDSPAAHHSPVYSADMIFLPGLALTMEQPMMDAMMDTPPSNNGYKAACNSKPRIIKVPSSMVAISVTTYVSNRSAAMPAQSPTLSPTLSAITAGLRGSSSGIPASTLPTRSAPTSAALVKMPPPRLSKIETRLAPSASAVSAVTTGRSFGAYPPGPVRYQN